MNVWSVVFFGLGGKKAVIDGHTFVLLLKVNNRQFSWSVSGTFSKHSECGYAYTSISAGWTCNNRASAGPSFGKQGCHSANIFHETKRFVDQAFSANGPNLWNSLSDNIRLINDYRNFKWDLKTWLFDMFWSMYSNLLLTLIHACCVQAPMITRCCIGAIKISTFRTSVHICCFCCISAQLV